MTSDDRYRAVEVARLRADLSVQQLWLRYLALGGSSDAFDVDGYLQGLVPLEVFQQDVLAQAVNEGLDELYHSLRVPLSATSEDARVDGVLHDVIAQLLSPRPADPDTGPAPPEEGREFPVRPPPPRPEP